MVRGCSDIVVSSCFFLDWRFGMAASILEDGYAPVAGGARFYVVLAAALRALSPVAGHQYRAMYHGYL